MTRNDPAAPVDPGEDAERDLLRATLKVLSAVEADLDRAQVRAVRAETERDMLRADYDRLHQAFRDAIADARKADAR